MDKVNIMELALYRLERANEDLETSKINFESNKLKASNNRSYYAILHALRAVLALDEKDFKKHSGVISYFNQNYIKTNIFSKDVSLFVKNASLIRNQSDYDDFYIASKEEAKEQIENAEYIIKVISEYLKNLS